VKCDLYYVREVVNLTSGTTGAIETVRAGAVTRARLGERLRELRIAAGLTQTALAGDRFSKEYVSQIERGKTRPTQETITWLAQRLGVDPSFLQSGVSSDERSRVEASLARAEALVEAHRDEDAIEEFTALRTLAPTSFTPELELRALAGESWARMETGEVRQALELLERARTIADAPFFSDVDRADVLYRIGLCRLRLSSVSTAVSLFTEALTLAESSDLPCDALRADILSRRSACYRRQRDFEAAREDVERALELSTAIDDRRSMARVYMQASLVAERMGHWVLARTYAEKAKVLYEELEDKRRVAGLLNNLGGLHLMLGKPEQAIEFLKTSFGTALDTDNMDVAAQAAGSLASVHLQLGEFDQAEQLARQALSILDGRDDFLHEIAPTQLVLGRALMEQGNLTEAETWLRASDASAEQLASVSHRAAAWIAIGDLVGRAGDEHEAARLYRSAAEALQDVRF
jgi:tetratricopeptide (TPR) repeat protein